MPFVHLTRLAVEPLEDRQLPAATITALFAAGVLTVEGTEGADRIALWQARGRLAVIDVPIRTAAGTVNSVAAADVRGIVVNALGGHDSVWLNQDQYGSDPIAAPATVNGGAGDDYLAGGWGGDTLDGSTGWDSLRGHRGNDLLRGGDHNDQLLGEAGDDTLQGQSGNDYLRGGAGDDNLSGGEGDDRLLGDEGNDRLRGEAGRDFLRAGAGNDYLDAGSAGEDADGQEGRDTNAWRWAVGGFALTDVAQQNSPTCSFLSALAAVAQRRPEYLQTGLGYLGDGVYRVRLFRQSEWVYQSVRFDGATTEYDPMPVGEGKFWVTLYHRAWVQERTARGLSAAAWPDEALAALTGGTAVAATATARSYLTWAVQDGRCVAASTWSERGAVGAKLIADHAYTVLGIDGAGVRLRNPWGVDGAAGSGDPADGVVTLTWAEFTASFYAFYVC